jgi:hypothetical protein
VRTLPLLLLAAILAGSPLHAQVRVTALDSSTVNSIWSGHPVDFALVAKGDTLYAAYYHGNTRQIIVSMRSPATGLWKHKTLTGAAATVGWDSHNSITMVIDAQGRIHLAGNMHNNPLRYWRSDVPGEIDSLKQVTSMVGTQETSVTYPVFVQALNGDLAFIHRDGGSGGGNHLINKWNPGTLTWSRLLSTNLFSGASTSGTRSVYFGDNDAGPVAGPDGWYHLFWFWRATPDAATTHRVSYMKTANLTSWFTSAGTPITLPVSFDNNPGVIVDDVPQYAGMINRGQIGFDAQARPILTYFKYDSTVAGGYTQLYNARLENGAWVVHKTTSWQARWSFGGTGSLVIQIEFGPVLLNANGQLTQWYKHWLHGKGVLILDPVTLQATQTLPDAYWPKALDTAYRVVNSTANGNPLQMQVNWLSVRSSTNASIVHALRWETWPENADQARAVSPPAGDLKYYRMSDPNVTALSGGRASAPRAGKAPLLNRAHGVLRVNPAGKDPTDMRGRSLPSPPENK